MDIATSMVAFLITNEAVFEMKRVTFYVDGFNFYYGLRTAKQVDEKWYKAYWIDLVKFFGLFLGEGQVLEKVVYFTASPLNKEKNRHQSAFLNANKLLNGNRFEVVRGKYISKEIKCPRCKYAIIRPEEKKTDVNISIRMLADCVMDATDIIVLVSGDSDLLPPIEFIQHNYPGKQVKAFFPPSIFSRDISGNIKAHKGKITLLEKNYNKFVVSQMPDSVTNGERTYTIPEKWKLSAV